MTGAEKQETLAEAIEVLREDSIWASRLSFTARRVIAAYDREHAPRPRVENPSSESSRVAAEGGGEVWRHNKSGALYSAEFTVLWEPTAKLAVVYRAVNKEGFASGPWWCCDEDDFLAKFTLVKP